MSAYHRIFCRGFNAQHCLINMAEVWTCLRHGGMFGTLMTDLFKGFDCLHHRLLIAKADAYGSDL